MRLDKIEKVSKIFEKIKSLDSEIIELDKTAMLIANGKCKIGLSLSVENLEKKEAEDNKVKLDEDGSLINTSGLRAQIGTSIYWFPSYFGQTSPAETTTPNDVLNSALSDNSALHVLAILLTEKQNERSKLLSQLQGHGVTIQ